MNKVHKTVRFSRNVHDYVKGIADRRHDGNFSLALDNLAQRWIRKQKKDEQQV